MSSIDGEDDENSANLVRPPVLISLCPLGFPHTPKGKNTDMTVRGPYIQEPLIFQGLGQVFTIFGNTHPPQACVKGIVHVPILPHIMVPADTLLSSWPPLSPSS